MNGQTINPLLLRLACVLRDSGHDDLVKLVQAGACC
jgi:hypothetical protein